MLARLAVCLSLATPAIAGQVTYTSQSPFQPLTGPSPHTFSVSVPQFDPQLGQLTRVYVFARLYVQGAVSIENTGSQTFSSSFYVSSPGYSSWAAYPAYGYFDYPFSSGVLGPFDGTIDYAGTSGAVVTFPQPVFPGPISGGAWVNDPGPGTPGVPLGSTSPAVLDLATGTGTINVVSDTYPNIQPQWDPTLTTWSFTMDGSARVDITYYFDPYPARFCTGEVAGGCPCAATAGPTGGCPSSVNAGGADLAASGASSVGADTFALAATGMPATTTLLFFQGTSSTHAGISFGDGKRCVGGTVVRLATKHAVNGSSSYPGLGDPPISVVGSTVVGALRSYQAWYRNADPAFCTPSTFNLTSAVATLWTP